MLYIMPITYKIILSKGWKIHSNVVFIIENKAFKRFWSNFLLCTLYLYTHKMVKFIFNVVGGAFQFLLQGTIYRSVWIDTLKLIWKVIIVFGWKK